MSKTNKPRLGRGLSSLLQISEPPEERESPAEKTEVSGGAPDRNRTGTGDDKPGAAVLDLPVASIQPNPHQPRREFNDTSIAELAASLKSTGLIQPVIVRQTAKGYELIAGERRLRAAKVAGLQTLPAIVKEVDGYTQAQMALIENIQREELNPLDRALAYRTLVQQLGLTHAELAARLGEDRTAITHFLRLLDLAEPVQEHIRTGKLTFGHGKVLAQLPADEQVRLAERVISQGLSVRNLERIKEEEKAGKAPPGSSSPPAAPSAHIKDLETRLSHHLGVRVQVKWAPKRGKGKVILIYDNLDQFEHLKDRLGFHMD